MGSASFPQETSRSNAMSTIRVGRSVFQTIPYGGLGDDEDTIAGVSFGTVRQPATLVKSADLQTALASPDDNDVGTTISEHIGLSDLAPALPHLCCTS